MILRFHNAVKEWLQTLYHVISMTVTFKSHIYESEIIFLVVNECTFAPGSPYSTTPFGGLMPISS